MAANNTASAILSIIIIPCYNCAPVIKRCLDSIDFSEAEIIVINDGSTDNTTEVIEQYQSNHPNVQLFNKVNGGVSSARNMGIKRARGKYLAFVDADDYLMTGGLKQIVYLAEKEQADVVLYKANYTTEDTLIPTRSIQEDPMQYYLFHSGIEVLQRYDVPDYYIWDAIYSRRLIEENGILCKEDLYLHEDDVFKGEVYSVAHKVIVTDLKLYCYVQASNQSSTHRLSPERQRELINHGWRAAAYRQVIMQKRCPDVLTLERLKYMRYVCPPKLAIEAQMSLSEYENVLQKFKDLGAYPLNYKWINVAHWYASSGQKLAWYIKTFLTNHPRLGYWIFSNLKSTRSRK